MPFVVKFGRSFKRRSTLLINCQSFKIAQIELSELENLLTYVRKHLCWYMHLMEPTIDMLKHGGQILIRSSFLD